MAVQIPDELARLASSIEITTQANEKVTRSRSMEIYSSGVRFSVYKLSLDWSLLDPDDVNTLSGLFDYAVMTAQDIHINLGARGDNPGLIPWATHQSVAVGETEVTLTNLTPGSYATKVGRLLKFTGHSKIYKVAEVPAAAGDGTATIKFSPPIRAAENATVYFDNLFFTAKAPAEISDSWIGGDARSFSIELQESL